MGIVRRDTGKGDKMSDTSLARCCRCNALAVNVASMLGASLCSRCVDAETIARPSDSNARLRAATEPSVALDDSIVQELDAAAAEVESWPAGMRRGQAE